MGLGSQTHWDTKASISTRHLPLWRVLYCGDTRGLWPAAAACDTTEKIPASGMAWTRQPLKEGLMLCYSHGLRQWRALLVSAVLLGRVLLTVSVAQVPT